MQFSPLSRPLTPLQSKYPPQHPVLKHPQSPLLMPETKFHSHTEPQSHSVDLRQHIQFPHTSILATKIRYMDRIVREAIEIEFHPSNMKR
jgi:hypothetical protein